MPPPRPIRTRRCLLLLAGLLAACGEVDEPTLATASDVPVGPALRLVETPLATWGGIAVDAAEQFQYLAAGLFLDSGRVLLAEYSAGEVREFDIDAGTFLGNWTRQGDGPGETRGISHLARVADTVAVYDVNSRRVTVMADGILVATYPLERYVDVAGHESAQVAWVFNKTSVGRDQGVMPGKPFWLRRVDLTSLETLDSIGPLPGDGTYLKVEDRSRAAVDLPFEPTTLIAAAGGTVVIAGHAADSVDVFDGGVVRRLAAPIPRRVVSEEDKQLWLEDRAPPGMPGLMRDAAREVMVQAEIPETQPFFAGLLLSEQAIWVAEFGPRSEVQRWWRYTEEWQPLSIPARLQPIAAADSMLLLVEYDDLGVPVVRVMRVEECDPGAC